MNRFLYAEANPTTLIDPTGHRAISAGGDVCNACLLEGDLGGGTPPPTSGRVDRVDPNPPVVGRGNGGGPSQRVPTPGDPKSGDTFDRLVPALDRVRSDDERDDFGQWVFPIALLEGGGIAPAPPWCVGPNPYADCPDPSDAIGSGSGGRAVRGAVSRLADDGSSAFGAGRRGGLASVASGRVGEALTLDRLRREGFTVIGEHISFRAHGQPRVVLDVVADKRGRLLAVESKRGARAPLTSNQVTVGMPRAELRAAGILLSGRFVGGNARLTRTLPIDTDVTITLLVHRWLE
jgi:hypothetical protein